jgi:Na+-transporting methylmalonyl-CoA/oxaloacetate decarboxylase gamma subunit
MSLEFWKTKKRMLSLFIIALFTVITFSGAGNVVLSSQYQKKSPNEAINANSNLQFVSDVLNEFNYSNVKAHTKTLASFGSRVLGYPGCKKAADYIIEKFKGYGLNTTVHEYTTIAPIDENSYIYVPSLNLKLQAFSLWPRGGIQEQVVQELSGRIYYARGGSLEELNGIDFSDAIVLLDFNSGKNWLKAISLGAKAVIFIEPSATDKFEVINKGTAAPLNAYLLYVGEKEGKILRQLSENNEIVSISSSCVWKTVVGQNIIGKLYGESMEDVIIISAHYDSWSVVPAISPAAEEAISTAVLIEMARLFSQLKPHRSIWFVAYSGHWEGGIGPYEFAEDVLLTTNNRIWLQIGVDISSETPFLDFIYFHQLPFMTSTSTYGYAILNYLSTMAARFGWIRSIAASELSKISIRPEDVPKGVSATSYNDLVTYNFQSDFYWGSQPDMLFLLDTMALIQASGMAFTARTQYARRLSWLTPLDDYSLINWDNVKPQAYLVAFTSFIFANYSDFGVDYNTIRPRRFALVGQAPLGLAILQGKTVEFSSETGWYKPVPNAIVRLYVFPNTEKETIWPFVYRYTKSDDNGSFVCHGLVPLTAWVLDAWRFDEDGNVEYALDFGYTGVSQGISGGISNSIYMTGSFGSLLIPLFKCVSLTFFDMIDISQIRKIQVSDVRNNLNNFYSSGAITGTFEALSKTFPVFYSSYIYPDGIAIVYVNRGQTVIFTANVAGGVWPKFVVSNSTDKEPEGIGIVVDKNIILYKTEFEVAKNLIRIIENRYKNFKEFEVRNSYLEYAFNTSKEYVNQASYSADRKLWSYFYGNTTLALNLAYKAYSNVLMPFFTDSSISVMILAFLILPFSVLFERVILRLTSWKRVIGIFGIMGVLFSVFTIVHPAFALMANSYMTIIGVGIVLLLIFVVSILIREMSDLARRYAVSKIGFHEFRGEAIAAVIHTMTTAAENIRRRPMRTILTFLTISIFTAGLIALTSVSSTYDIYITESKIKPTFEGILIRKSYGFPPEGTGGGILDQSMLEFLEASYSGTHIISPRIWLYPQYVNMVGNILRISKAGDYATSYSIVPSAVMGISDEELKLMLSNYSETFYPMLLESHVILPKSVADELNRTLALKGQYLRIGDKIHLWGYGNFTFVGTVMIESQLYDPNGYFWLPVDPGFSTTLSLSSFTYPSGMAISPINPNNIVFMNWKTALKFGGFISSIALIPKEGVSMECTKEIASQLVNSLPLETSNAIWLSTADKAIGMLRYWSLKLAGGTYIFTIAITVISILNFMLGTIQERRKEIFTYQSVGLSPAGALLMFVTEITTITLGGVLLGYLIGLGLDRIFIIYKLLPPDFTFNFISITVFISVLIVVGSTLVVSLYPAMLASRMITPSYERKWKPETKPKGNIWELNFPLVVRDKPEVIGILNYMKEYFSEAGYAGSGHRIVKIGDVDREKLSFDFEVVLTPMETGVTQRVKLYFQILPDERKQLSALIELISGDRSFFTSRNYAFLDLIRNQVLLWRSLPEEDRNRYMGLV